MFYQFRDLLYLIIILINIKSLKTFNVNFHYNYNLQAEPFNTQIYKRESTTFFDKASFSLNGFEKIESIPVLFPIDICIFNLEGEKYATALHMKRNGARHLEVLKMKNGSYDVIADIAAPKGIAMDCINFNNKGYVALALNLSEPVKYAKEGSPIYEISGNRLRAVQYFPAPNLMTVYLRASGNEFFLLHTYSNSEDTANLHCPYFKWSGSAFNKMGRIPCSNARQLAPFSIDYESYVAVANYADQRGRTSTNSEIYKYSRDKKKFMLFQKIKTNGAVDVQYFSVPNNELRRQHFLVFGNSISTASLAKREKAKREGKNLEADSVFYLFDKGQFIPYQKLSLYAVKKFLPVQNVEAEKFILLVACTDQDIKIYNLNDWKFEESKVQFTEGALGKGVANMRIYQENERSYLIIANELMADNETNIFLPIFKQEEDANALRQQIIDWSKAETQRLQTVNTNGLSKLVEEKLKNLEQLKYLPKIQDIDEANIQTVITESLVYPKLKMSGNYWTALNYVNQALDTLEIMIKQKQRLKRDISNENLEYIYETLNVNTLNVNKLLKAKRVNKINTGEPEFQNIQAPKVVVSDKYSKPLTERVNPAESLDYRDEDEFMTVRNLQISGKLNEYQWPDLLNNTLKRKEEIQFLKSPVDIGSLKTDTLLVNSDKINEQNLAALIPINMGKYVINQDIQFAAPITANRVEISERLNNLHVFQGQFDVLLKKSNKTQVIEGMKNVTNIKVLEPITIAGKMMGRQLEAISPNKFIHEELVLQGNYMINGDVNINHQLNTLDLIDLKEKLSAKQILDMGIRMDKSLKDVNLKFLQPLRANNSLVSFVNQHDLQRLVKLNQDDIQIIEGTKVFGGSLEISRGFSEVKNLNGVDMEKLERNAFLKNNNQTIRVPMKLGTISAKSIESPTVLLNSKNYTDYLSLTGNQSVHANLVIDNLKTQHFTVEHLNTDGKIFNQHLQDIYQQKSRNAPQEDIFLPKRKFHGSIYVQNLILNTTINNKSVEEIENHLLQLEGNIKYVGNFKFNYAMNVTNLTFQGKLNDLTAQEFGKSWLQKIGGKQEFTAAQSIAEINAEEGIQLQGKINGFTMDDLYAKTYWINRDEYIENVNFENPIEITGSLTTQTLNNYMVPQDVFYKQTKDTPITLQSLTVDENFIVEGSINNLTTINSINICELQDFLYNTESETLYVERAYFSQTPPLYKTLNSYNIRKTLDSVWLANENVVLPNHVEIADAYLEGLLEFEGPINNMNLDYLKENYFSKSKSQEVSVEMVFSEGAECEGELNVDELQVFGPLIERESGEPVNFDKFVQNTLKTSGPHVISGNWSLLEAIIQGNLNKVLINQLNLVDDIVHTVKPQQAYQVKAPKSFQNIHIEDLYADPYSSVNQIPVANWIKDSVYVYENYTIKGVTAIDSLNVYNNLMVLGKLNNITFNENSLLLQNLEQHIPGHVKIISHLPEEKRFLTNNMENLYADNINGQYVMEFLENLVPAATTSEIKSHLIFKHPLKVEKYEGPEGFLTQNQWLKRDINEQRQTNRNYMDNSQEKFGDFVKIKDYLENITKNNVYKLDHFDVIQTIEIQSEEVFTLSLDIDNKIVDILIVFTRKFGNVTIYEWSLEKKQFEETNVYNWLPLEPFALSILQKRFEKFPQPLKIEQLQEFLQQDLNHIQDVLLNSHKLNNYYEFLNKNCILYLKTSEELQTYCLNSKDPFKINNFPPKPKQILALTDSSMALLYNNSLIIYDTLNKTPKIWQKLPLNNAQKMAFVSFKHYKFLAVLSNSPANALNQGIVQIYRSINSAHFTFLQSFECPLALKLEFFYIEKSQDLILNILTESSSSALKPYLVYLYQGVKGFQEILTESILPDDAVNFNLLKLYSEEEYLVTLIGPHRVTLIDVHLKEIL